jgi:hypothetical protein
MAKGTRLELTWVGKDERLRLEPRILLEDPARSDCAKERRGEADRFDFASNSATSSNASTRSLGGSVQPVSILLMRSQLAGVDDLRRCIRRIRKGDVSV